MKLQHKIHLYNRFGFGLGVKHLNEITKVSKAEIVSKLFKDSESINEMEIDLEALSSKLNSNSWDKKRMKSLLKESRAKVKELNYKWCETIFKSNQQLREKMTLFWANHFPCRDNNVFHLQLYNNIIRNNSLGNFKTLLLEVSKSASMSKYLNNKQNRVNSPNENFARELMELFTLGRDILYSEQDIKEAARAFTGWNFDQAGGFVLKRKQHDFGRKTIFGRSGQFNGEDVIDLILSHRECAEFVCRKIYTYFINDDIDSEQLEELVSVFYPSYNIDELVRYIMKTDWFYDDKNLGVKIKSPLELMAGLYKIIPFEFNRPKQVLSLQKIMGQVLFYPPNVAGWAGGKNWINANTLMFRMKLPSILYNNGEITSKAKGEFEDGFDKINRGFNSTRKLDVTISWADFERQNLSDKVLESLLIICKLDSNVKAYLKTCNNVDVKSYCIQLMSLPEYQLC